MTLDSTVQVRLQASKQARLAERPRNMPSPPGQELLDEQIRSVFPSLAAPPLRHRQAARWAPPSPMRGTGASKKERNSGREPQDRIGASERRAAAGGGDYVWT